MAKRGKNQKRERIHRAGTESPAQKYKCSKHGIFEVQGGFRFYWLYNQCPKCKIRGDVLAPRPPWWQRQKKEDLTPEQIAEYEQKELSSKYRQSGRFRARKKGKAGKQNRERGWAIPVIEPRVGRGLKKKRR